MLVRLFAAAAITLLMSGCSTYAVPRYGVSVDNVTTLKTQGGAVVNVGTFNGDGHAGQTEIMCRGVGPIKTPDGESFAGFVRKGLVDELRMANLYSASAPVTLSGQLSNVNFDSMAGRWDLALRVSSSNGRSLSVTEQYAYASSFYGETACNQTAQAMMPAVQNLLGKVVRDPGFPSLLK